MVGLGGREIAGISFGVDIGARTIPNGRSKRRMMSTLRVPVLFCGWVTSSAQWLRLVEQQNTLGYIGAFTS